jgi:hypothetical protein
LKKLDAFASVANISVEGKSDEFAHAKTEARKGNESYTEKVMKPRNII